MRAAAEQRYQDIVVQIEGMAREHMGEALRIGYLCQACRISERTLRSAFQSVHGRTPYRHLRELRMREARQALLQAASPATTVTAVAMQFGFLELGRFSVEYRTAFGERPSETLRRSISGVGQEPFFLSSPMMSL